MTVLPTSCPGGTRGRHQQEFREAFCDAKKYSLHQTKILPTKILFWNLCNDLPRLINIICA